MLSQLASGVVTCLTPPVVYWLLLGALIGLFFGVLPAIGATTGVVLFLPFTYGMDLATAVVFLCAIYATGQYGDSVASILLNTPGGPGTVASCWDGYPMARQGHGVRALAISAFGSMLGGIAGSIGMVMLAWPLTNLAMLMQPPEYFALGIMALSLVSIASKGETLKGLIMACFGLALSFVGQDPVAGFVDRFAFGVEQLAGGLPSLTVFVGLFAIAQIIRILQEGDQGLEELEVSASIGRVLEGFMDVLRRPLTVLRSIGVGMYIGILPALGVTTATVTSYLVEKKYSPEREKFGHGAPAGLVAAEVAKGCCVVGDMIPTFTLGIPGSITGAIVMAAFVLHGIQPGPAFLTSGSAPYVVFAGIALTQILILLVGAPLIRYFSYVVKVPNSLLAPALAVLCFIGALVERNIYFDVAFLLAFGLLGYALDKLNYSAVCLVLGLILGPLVETNFHRTLSMGFGSPYLLWTRPLTVLFFAVTLLFLLWPYVQEVVAAVTSGTRGRAGSRSEERPAAPITWNELALLAAVTAVGVTMVITAHSYPPRVGLFPTVTSATMLVFVVWRLAPVWLRRTTPIGTLGLARPRLADRAMSWHWSLGLMGAYFLLVYAVGFLGATAVFCAAVPALLRYHSNRGILAFSASVTISVYLFTQSLGVVLPAWPW